MMESKTVEKILETPKLKPCPFCGNKAYMERSIGRGGEYEGYYVQCGTCSIRTKTYRDQTYQIEASENFFTNTNNLLAARAWNIRNGEGTYSCPKCGVSIPHIHKEILKGDKGYFFSNTYLVILNQTPKP